MHTNQLPARFAFLAAAFTVGACGGGSDASFPPAVQPDAATPEADGSAPVTPVDAGARADSPPPGDAEVLADAGDHGAVSTTYPAFTVDYPQIANYGGVVLDAPVVVTITWPGDTNAPTYQAYGDGIGATTFWAGATAEYDVGNITSGAVNHVELTETAPSTITAEALASFIQANAGGAASDAGPPWPAPTLDANGNSQTIYAVYLSPSTSVTEGGQDMCEQGAAGYHDNVVVNGKPVSYAVILDCQGFQPSDVQETAAHELVEAATDPYPEMYTANGYWSVGWNGFDANHLSWDVYTGFQDELADACENWPDSYYQYETTGSFPYWLQRIWSNRAALQGHDPCAPQPTGTYYGMTTFPSQMSSLSLDLTQAGYGPMTSLGFHAAVGQSVTFQVGYFSDGPEAAWPISYDFPAQMQLTDNNGNAFSNGTATVSIDLQSGQNGQKAYVTVTPTAAGALGFQSMAITWDNPGQSSPYLFKYLPILIANK